MSSRKRSFRSALATIEESPLETSETGDVPPSTRVVRFNKQRDPVWDCFEGTSDKEVQKCLECEALIKTIKGSKTGLVKHIALHRKEHQVLSRESIKSWLIACMICVLNIPCNVFSSPIMKKQFWLARLGPISDRLARRYTDKEAKNAKKNLKDDLALLKGNGAVFTLTADEWTYQRKRFLGITLHSSRILPVLQGKSFVVLSRFMQRANAKNLQKVLTEALREIGLEITDIRGITTDGAAVMRKLGRKLAEKVAPQPFYHQLCLAHGIHLGVSDFFKSAKTGLLGLSDLERQEARGVIVRIDENEDDDDYVDIESEGDSLDTDENDGEDSRHSLSDFIDVIMKVRRECKKFHVRPALNDELMAISERRGCRKKLVLDNSIRWNSTVRMLRNFVAQEEALRQLYNNMNKPGDFPLTDNEVSKLKEVISVLQHTEQCVKRLSLGDITMELADNALQAMFRKLRAEESSLARDLTHHLFIRVLQRRGVASKCARYVVERTQTCEMESWLEESKQRTVLEGDEIIFRTFLEPGSIEQELSKFVRTRGVAAPTACITPESGTFDDFDLSRQRQTQHSCNLPVVPPNPRTLMQLHENPQEGDTSLHLPSSFAFTLETLQPTSIPAERLFSSARHARRYSQERQDDERPSNYVFLKYFFTQKKPWVEFAEKNPEFEDGRLGVEDDLE